MVLGTSSPVLSPSVSATAGSPPAARSIAALLDSRSADKAPALVEGISARWLPWSEVARRVGNWRGAPPTLVAGSRIGVSLSDPVEMAAAVLGAIAAGFSVAPLDPALPTAEMLAAVRTLGLGAVVTGPGDLGPVRTALRAAGVDLWSTGPGSLESAGARSGPGVLLPGRGAALLLATSGTTGRPKLVPLREAQLLRVAGEVVSHHRLGPQDCGYSPLPLFHINGLVVGLLASLVGGHRLVVDRRFSAGVFWRVVEREEVTWLNLVPAALGVLATLPAPPPEVRRRVRFARSASAPLAAATLERFEARTGIPVLETYGMTEAASQITANPIEPDRRRPGSVGLPVVVELRVVDGSGRPVAPGELGEVQIRGDSVVESVWAPADSDEADRPVRGADGWLATGDLGRLDADGFLVLAGRADDVINRGGEKLYPREVEEVLLADPAVRAAAVVGAPHPLVGEEPVAFVVLDGDAADGVERLRRRCVEALARHRRPAEIVVVDVLPTGPNGKVRRAELRRRLAGGPAGSEDR